MLRQNAYPRLSLAAESARHEAAAEASTMRRSVARVSRTVGRIAVAPFAAVIAAIAGVVFVILLPVCGIASVAEATARSTWALARGALRREVRPPAQR